MYIMKSEKILQKYQNFYDCVIKQKIKEKESYLKLYYYLGDLIEETDPLSPKFRKIKNDYDEISNKIKSIEEKINFLINEKE